MKEKKGIQKGGKEEGLEEEESGRRTYVDLTENDVYYAANYDEEVKDIPGITKVALHRAGGGTGRGGGGGCGLEGEQQQHLLKAEGRGGAESGTLRRSGQGKGGGGGYLLSNKNKCGRAGWY